LYNTGCGGWQTPNPDKGNTLTDLYGTGEKLTHLLRSAWRDGGCRRWLQKYERFLFYPALLDGLVMVETRHQFSILSDVGSVSKIRITRLEM